MEPQDDSERGPAGLPAGVPAQAPDASTSVGGELRNSAKSLRLDLAIERVQRAHRLAAHAEERSDRLMS
jgi:hypothetical protein